MPLRDHFRPPLAPGRHWNAFHHAWATAIAWDLNRRLPEGYFAEPNVQFGIQIDVAAWIEGRAVPSSAEVPVAAVTGGSAAVSPASWTPAVPSLTVPFTLITDIVEVSVFHTAAGSMLVGAIELVSPANKDRPEHRDAFVAKCKAYLQEGVGLAVVDIVTGRKASLHPELLAATSSGPLPAASLPPVELVAELYAAAYRPVERDGGTKLEIWLEELALGEPLPTLPLWLRGGPCLPVAFAAIYEETCRQMRVP